MKLRFTPRATRDLLDIAEYLRERSPQAALQVRNAIFETLEDLALFPEAGRRQSVEGVRKLVTRKYAYLIYYSVERPLDEIIILTIQQFRAAAGV